MRTKHLLTVVFVFLISTVFTMKAADDVKVEKTIDGAAMNATDYPDGSLMEVTDLTLTGTWNTPEVLLLRKALKTKEKPYNAALTTVIFDAEAVINDMEHLFENCRKLANVTLPTKENDSPVSFKNAFSTCWYYTGGSIDLSSFSNISAMDSAFYNAYKLASVTMPTKVNAIPMSFEYAFKSSLIRAIDLSGFTNITELFHAFDGAKDLKTIKFPAEANENPMDFEKTFYGCESLPTIDLSVFTNITNLVSTFQNCAKITSITFPETSNLNEISLNNAFNNCSVLNTVDLSVFPNIKDINATFNNCKQLSDVKFSETKNERELNFLATFAGTAITDLDLSMFPNITRLTNTFSGCSSLTNMKFSSEENTLVTDLSGLFNYCSSITTADLSMFSNIDKLDRTFNGCSNLKEVKLPANVNEKAVSVSMTFADCASLDTPLDLSNFTRLTMMNSTFSGCAKLPEVKLSVVENDTEMQLKKTFFGCAALTTPVDLSGLTNIIRMENTFAGCTMLQGIKMPVKEQAEPLFFLNAFQDCASLVQPIDLSAFKSISDIGFAFKGCSSLPAVLLGSVPADMEEAFEGVNPNCLKYIPEVEELPFGWEQTPNVIFNGKARKDIELEDGHLFYCPQAFELGEWKITYTRDFTGNFANKIQGWNTICLPFDATLKAEGTGVSPWGENKGYWISELSGSISTDSIDFTEVDKIQANTPYIIALPGDEIKDMASMEGKTITFSATNITIPATPEKMTGKIVDNYAIMGTYAPIVEQPMYLIERGTGTNVDTFVYNEKGSISPFRAYLTSLNPDAQNAASLKLTAIIPEKPGNSIDMLRNEGMDIHIYTIDGILTIDAKQAIVVEIYATDGHVVCRVELNEGMNSIRDLNAGVYVVAGNKIAVGN